ncbi:hypothetical protein CFP56_004027 [Quercus suber]|uniref:Uncharacterized protein n=1 Tax=Quercus suber TaxID=58331 RepID=A0AAW0IH93_QUESU
MRMHAIDNLMNHPEYINLSAALTDYVTCDDSFSESNRINPISKTDMHALLREMSIYQLDACPQSIKKNNVIFAGRYGYEFLVDSWHYPLSSTTDKDRVKNTHYPEDKPLI